MQTTTFTIDNERVTLELETARGYLSICGVSGMGSGQMLDSIPEVPAGAHEYGEELNRIVKAWRAYHLKPLEEIPAEILEELESDFLLVNGERYWAKESPPVDDPSDSDFDESSDVIDSRDVIKRIEELESYENLPPEYREELAELKKLEDQASGYAADWQHGETLIRDSYFQEYAQELAEDCGLINSDSRWPNNCIDWEQAARELQQDYTAVEFRGVTYWIR